MLFPASLILHICNDEDTYKDRKEEMEENDEDIHKDEEEGDLKLKVKSAKDWETTNMLLCCFLFSESQKSQT